MHAVLTQRRLAEAAASLSLSFRRGLVLLVGDCDSVGLSRLFGISVLGERGCGCSSSAIDSVSRNVNAPRRCVEAREQAAGKRTEAGRHENREGPCWSYNYLTAAATGGRVRFLIGAASGVNGWED